MICWLLVRCALSSHGETLGAILDILMLVGAVLWWRYNMLPQRVYEKTGKEAGDAWILMVFFLVLMVLHNPLWYGYLPRWVPIAQPLVSLVSVMPVRIVPLLPCLLISWYNGWLQDLFRVIL